MKKIACCVAVLLFMASYANADQMAIGSGTIKHGEIIPLPVFADGTPAKESECRWIVSVFDLNLKADDPGLGLPTDIYCEAPDRKVVCKCKHVSGSRTGMASYLIIAVRPD